ncbi:serine hydrolase domain-containing protein [Gymnodinialimonas sp. 2305UL16-5]|uniref:serine hydrolase domain-containing protein n=1 Tax=Gymnodinialimonas mytili TaxID=3126503 RepID=UPI0030B25919
MSLDQTGVLPESMLAHFKSDHGAVAAFLLKDGHTQFTLSGDTGSDAACDPGDVVFEIGSITKVFTGILLSVLVEEGRIDPNRPLCEMIPALEGTQPWLTPNRLATHSAGLPKLHIPYWKALLLPVGDDFYADFSRDDLFDWVRRWRGAAPKPNAYAYSNMGFGLLGEALAAHEGRDFGDLLREKVLDPIGLNDTSAHLEGDRTHRFAQPHDAVGRPVKPWTFKAIAAAGALRSTPNDMAQFARRVINAIREPHDSLDKAICRSALPAQRGTGRDATESFTQCLGWISIRWDADRAPILFHNGGTAGMTSELYVCPEKRAAIGIFASNGLAAGFWSGLKFGFQSPQKAASDVFEATSAT